MALALYFVLRPYGFGDYSKHKEPSTKIN